MNFLKQNIINPQQDILQSNIYGVEHLLRLIISFPGLLSTTTMDGISLSVLILNWNHYVDLLVIDYNCIKIIMNLHHLNMIV